MGEYEKFVESIPAGERVSEPSTGIDNRLDFLGPKIVDMANRTEKIEEVLASLEAEGVAVMPKKIEQIPFSYNLISGGGVILSEEAPFSGHIKQVAPHWPDGCDGLFDIRVGHGVVNFCPDEGFLALNDATPTYPFNEWVDDHEEIWVEMRNRSMFPHIVTVTVVLEGVT